MKSFLLLVILALFMVAISNAVLAHDTWIQPQTNVVRVGDTIALDLLLGNHGNDHRDFKMAGKTAPADQKSLEIIGPDGTNRSLKNSFQDLGYTDKDGFWMTSFAPSSQGLYTVVGTSDKVVSYAPKRSVKSFKTYFLATRDLRNVPSDLPGYNKPTGAAFELVPESNPVTPMGPGTRFQVRLLLKGKPLQGATISFIPRGVPLKEGFDDNYERKTNAEGRASFEFKSGNFYLIAAHYEAPNEKGEGYDETKYSATICLLVPQICPCCGE